MLFDIIMCVFFGGILVVLAVALLSPKRDKLVSFHDGHNGGPGSGA